MSTYPHYPLRVRNTQGVERGAWATYVKQARTSAVPSVGQSELARRVGVERTTVYRWETGQQRPENAETVRAVAEVLGLDLDEALAAAGLRPGVAPPTEPTRDVDEIEAIVLGDDRLSDEMKVRIIKLHRERRERDRLAAIEDTRQLYEMMRDGGGA